MDGFQKLLKNSVRAQVSVWISLAIVTMSLVSGGLSFAFSFYEAHKLQDDQLRQFAALIQRNGVVSISTGQKIDFNVDHIDHEAQIILRPISDDTPADSAFNQDLPLGLSTVRENHTSWRVFVVEMGNNSKIALAQATELRDEIAISGGLYSLIPTLLLVPILVLLTAKIIHRTFLPVQRLSQQVERSSSNQPLILDKESIPDEIRPFVVSINQLINRLYDSVEQQKRFIANAAHELRTPLTALSLQAESIDNSILENPNKEKFTRLREGLHRSRTLLEQLLTHARMQQNSNAETAYCSLMTTVSEVMADMVLHAQRKDIDIGLVDGYEAQLNIARIDLYTLLKNLVDNAIRYTPAGGTVDISVKHHAFYLEISVRDSGPGIAENEIGNVLEPFYRGEQVDVSGSGLGLSIVTTIANRINGKLLLKNQYSNGKIVGLNASVFIPYSRG